MEGIEKRELPLDEAEVIPGLTEMGISKRRYTGSETGISLQEQG